jgi:hypothetical protein
MLVEQFIGEVRDGQFCLLWPKEGSGQILRLTKIGIMAAQSPEAAQLDVGTDGVLLVSGQRNGDWIYTAEISERAGPILRLIAVELWGRTL